METNFNELLEQLVTAAADHNWLVVVLVAVLIAVPIVLRLLGKEVPLVSSILDIVAKIIPMLKKKAPPPPAEGSGLASVVPVEEKKDEPK